MLERRTGRGREDAWIRSRLRAPYREGGWQDWNLVPFAIANDYIIVTLNRRDFFKQYARLEVHPGLVVVVAQPPRNKAPHQVALFAKALEAFAAMNGDLINKVMEVLPDGSTRTWHWNAEQHDVGHIGDPSWQ